MAPRQWRTHYRYHQPLGDGTYYQAGGSYAFGSVYVDAKNQPVHIIGTARSTPSIIREIHALEEWKQANLQGEKAAIELEARRQQARLERCGFIHAFKPSDVCAGGKRLDDFETASSTVEAATAYADTLSKADNGSKGHMWNVPAWLGKTCATCSLYCEVAVETQDGKPTGITRFSNVRPLGDNVPMIQIELPKYDR